MKRTILLMTAFALIFSGCTVVEERDSGKRTISGDTYYESYEYNNDVPLEACTPTAYELEELYDYFGRISLIELEAAYFGKPPQQYIHDIDEVNDRFPITNLRAMYDPVTQKIGDAYSAYRTVEGGYFYVIWKEFTWAKNDPDSTVPSDIPLAGKIIYLTEATRNLDFSGIIEGESTAEDVAQIDPNISIQFGGFILSDSYINRYCIVSVIYNIDRENYIDDDVTERKELKVESINTLTGLYENRKPWGDFLEIREEDFP